MMKYESQVPHIDLQYDNGDPVDHKVLLYYINDSDGPTYFFNEACELQDTVYPKPGRAIIFDGSNIHAASNPVKHPFRMVINIDFQGGK
jgi:ectoine hydroxylase-related dioxygenase (phytanoyl-CoA dioxygenase family)